jgi:predicted RNA-binding protein with PUA-like domain
MRYWLIKSEPVTYGIEHMARDKKTAWGGVRNYQARNFMRDQMKVGDKAFFYHSNTEEPGIVGIVEVSEPAHPDETQFDKKSHYYDAASKREEPRWLCVGFKFVKKTPLVTIHKYPGADHAFARHGGRTYSKPEADRALELSVDFFKQHLG